MSVSAMMITTAEVSVLMRHPFIALYKLDYEIDKSGLYGKNLGAMVKDVLRISANYCNVYAVS